MATDPYEPFRIVMRQRHGICGPYRLGIAIGEAGMADELPPPPHYQEFGRKIFAAGLEAGKRRAAEHGA